MCIICSKIEDAGFVRGEFDLITCYSVLHHLPDYSYIIQKLSTFLREKGVMYLDHEMSPFYWRAGGYGARIIKMICLRYAKVSDSAYFKIMGLNTPSVDIALSDWWITKEHHIDHEKIEAIFSKMKFRFFTRIDYHQKKGWLFNPFFVLYKHTCEPNMSLWLAIK